MLLKLLTAISVVSSITQGLPKLLTAISIVSTIVVLKLLPRVYIVFETDIAFWGLKTYFQSIESP